VNPATTAHSGAKRMFIADCVSIKIEKIKNVFEIRTQQIQVIPGYTLSFYGFSVFKGNFYQKILDFWITL
jgi:hypothetical protein